MATTEAPTIAPTMAPSIAPTVNQTFAPTEEPNVTIVGRAESTVVLGIVFGLLGSICINTGNNIQSLGMHKLAKKEKKRKAAATEEDPEDYEPPPPSSSWIWVVGTLVFVSGSLLNFASYAFAPQSMLASLESVQFVTNILFGKFLLKAKVTTKMYIGTVITVLGTVVAVLFSSSTVKDLDIEALFECWLAPPYIMYLVIMGGALLVIPTFYKSLEIAEEKETPIPHSHIIKPLMYSTWSALFGTQSVVQAKVLAELLAIQSKGEVSVFKHWFFWCTLLMWLFTVGVWLHRLNDALSKFDPLFIIPVLQCNFIFFAIVSGGIFFGEFELFSVGQWFGFTFGVIIMFAGLGLLTPAPSEPVSRATQTGSNLGNLNRQNTHHYDSEDDEENEYPEYRHPSPSLYSIRNVGHELKHALPRVSVVGSAIKESLLTLREKEGSTVQDIPGEKGQVGGGMNMRDETAL
ncbi:hypothetical protein TrST_g2248 [Triparma strigata]|uniref:Magnesium transporter n=1 Tax=Triparma strigata TaxID=1606541 RepID=A0A9W7APP6_9STRA|nr:hypothetical protein TrST_g2248 [Triparma strigata]